MGLGTFGTGDIQSCQRKGVGCSGTRLFGTVGTIGSDESDESDRSNGSNGSDDSLGPSWLWAGSRDCLRPSLVVLGFPEHGFQQHEK